MTTKDTGKQDTADWLMPILLKVQNSGIDFAKDVRSPASLALAQGRQSILAELESRLPNKAKGLKGVGFRLSEASMKGWNAYEKAVREALGLKR